MNKTAVVEVKEPHADGKNSPHAKGKERPKKHCGEKQQRRGQVRRSALELTRSEARRRHSQDEEEARLPRRRRAGSAQLQRNGDAASREEMASKECSTRGGASAPSCEGSRRQRARRARKTEPMMVLKQSHQMGPRAAQIAGQEADEVEPTRGNNPVEKKPPGRGGAHEQPKPHTGKKRLPRPPQRP